MTVYLPIADLELEVRTGRGIAIIVEGETYDDDAWFYGRWFNDRANEVTFFPQNGWRQVIIAVAELRRRCPGVPVYGIIDRDFVDDAALDADFNTQGILRTPCYTLENYLLDPVCWSQVFALIFSRGQDQARGWDDLIQVQTYIEQAYRTCISLAAHNRVIKFGNEHYSAQAALTRETDRTYREHPDSLANIDPVAKLRDWGNQLGAVEDLGAAFEQFRDELEQSDLTVWSKQVSVSIS